MKTVLFCLLMLSAYIASAQSFTVTPEDVKRKESFLLMRDGTVMKGQILRQDSSIISVRRRGGDMSFVEADQVVSVSGKQPVAARGTVGQSRYQTFIFRDGTQLEGTYVSRDSTMITVRKRNGRLTYFEPELLLRTDSATVATTVEAVDSYPNRFPTWMLNGQTAYNPEKGRFYYRNTWLLLNEFTYGITSFWSVSANFVTPIPYLLVRDTYAGGGSSYVQNNTGISTRFSAALGRQVHLAVTASYRQPSGYPEGRGEGTFRGLLTLGSSQNNITLSYGLVTTRAEFPIYYTPIYSSAMPSYSIRRIPDRSFLTIGLVQKLSRSLTLISDNQIRLANVNYYEDTYWKTALSLALRIDRPRHTFDLGLSGLINQRGDYVNGRQVNVLPYVAYNLLIGKP